jgi:spermidine/putrescine transport system ATP-binding protein
LTKADSAGDRGQLDLDGVSKSYGAVEVLRPTSLSVADGEFLTILGPSGCGKTTILRILGGFAEPSAGRVVYAGRDLTRVPTHHRPFNTVFQDYALFPHMTVAANIGYGLMVRGLRARDRQDRVGHALGMVGLSGFGQRMPAQLSGGQRQRVALARAIVCEPKVILLDEPLAALDAEFRRQMQGFLKDLQRSIRTSFVFVTHDQEEAITMSDRIVVMRAGAVEQVGSPEDLYLRPQTRFVAGFFGKSNLIPGRIAGPGRIDTALGPVTGISAPPGGDGAVVLSLRPENLRLSADASLNDVGLAAVATVSDVVFAGSLTHVHLRPDADPSLVLMANVATSHGGARLSVGDKLHLTAAARDIVVIPDRT